MLWPDSKHWVYSITYDEGCADLLAHALPLHQQHGIPGHVAIVAPQVGVPRDVPGSSYNGMMILSRAELDGLCDQGWGVSCHSMTHGSITPESADYEVAEAKAVLEARIGRQTPLFTVPGCNDNYPAAIAPARAAGYRGIMTIYDDINRQDVDLFRLARVPIHVEYPGPFYSTYDPYKRIHQAMDCGGWIIDYCHCPLPGRAIHPAKDCTLEQLAERFETVRRLGGDDVWLAEPGDVVDHIITQRRGL